MPACGPGSGGAVAAQDGIRRHVQAKMAKNTNKGHRNGAVTARTQHPSNCFQLGYEALTLRRVVENPLRYVEAAPGR